MEITSKPYLGLHVIDCSSILTDMSLPTTAFKEWSLVCAALACGRQSVILRKGGIAEGRAGFAWQHREFALFPTHFHEQSQHLRNADEHGAVPANTTEHTISLIATLEISVVLTDWEQVMALTPFHFWTEETVRARFDYSGDRALSVGVLRVARLPQPYSFPDAPGYGGCRSWVKIPEAPSQGAPVPVLDDATHARRMADLTQILKSARIPDHV